MRGPHGGGRATRCGGIAPRDGQAEGLPWRTDGEGGVAVFTDTRPLTAGRPAAVLHVAAGNYVGEREDGPLLLEVERGGHFWGGGPRKCGVLRRARAGDGPGAKLLSCSHADRTGGIDSFEGGTELLNIIRIVCEAETSAARGDLLHNPDGLCYGADSPAHTVVRREPAGRYSLPCGEPEGHKPARVCGRPRRAQSLDRIIRFHA